ncbi:MAG: lysophospholipid acyltransferase family protein [Lachnospirales bacterium]
MIKNWVLTIKWWVFYLPFSLIKIAPAMSRLEKRVDELSFLDYKKEAAIIATKWAKGQVEAVGLSEEKGTLDVVGLDNLIKDRPALFVSNHQGIFDTAIVMAYLDIPKSYIAKVELSKIPLLGKFMAFTGCIFIDRNDPKNQLKSIMTGIDYLKRGLSVCVYPEGTRGEDATLGEFKAGTFKLATKTGVPIVPITLNGTFDLLERNKFRFTAGTKAQIVVHKPIETENMTKEEKAKINVVVQEIVDSALWK